MKSSLKADDFYVIMKNPGYDDETPYFSVTGLMFMSELVLEAITKAGLEPAKVTIRVGANTYAQHNDRLSIAYPSPRTSVVSHIRVVKNHLILARRGGKDIGAHSDKKGMWSDEWDLTDAIPLADPELVNKLAEIIKISLPKHSKYEKK